MFVTYFILFFSGMFLANGVPHFVKGITGEKHVTPFKRPSSALTNVLWGSANFILGFLLLHFSLIRSYHFIWSVVVFFAGFILLAISLATNWSNDDIAEGKSETKK